MQVKIAAGETFDVLTKDELREVMLEVASGYLRPPENDLIEAAVTLDGSGDGTVEVYRVRVGYEFFVNRLTFAPTGYSFDSPYTTAGGLNLYRGNPSSASGNADLVDGYQFGGTTGNSLPAVLTESQSRAIILRDGQPLFLQVVGGPANGSLLVHGHGLLSPLAVAL